jgi:peptidyl-dipeptidase A
MKTLTHSILLLSFSLLLSCKNNEVKMRADFDKFLSDYDSVVIPLSKEMNLAEWNASISGKSEDYNRFTKLKQKYALFHSNKATFKFLEKVKASNIIDDSIKQRQLQVIYLKYLTYQADTNLQKEIIELENSVEQKFSTFRAEINGKQYTDNDIEDILKTSTDNALLQQAWEAHKKIGSVVANDIITLTKKRNALARQLGFANFYEMSLKLNDQTPQDIEKLFDQLDELTAKSFGKVKNDMNMVLAKRYKIDTSMLMPWHYQNRFFQEAPSIYPINLNKYYKHQNLEKITAKFYASIDLPIDDLISKSDLYEKPGKNQHAFCTDIDNEGDIRVLCNIKPSEEWMNTMLHEFGHAAYDKYIDRNLPFELREPAHIFTTEGIAMLFERMTKNPQWLVDMLNINKSEARAISDNCYRTLRLEKLVFSRWVQVVYRFEKQLYENPDQDLNSLWWNLVEKYQLLKKPVNRNQPDWASKIHIATFPCYYHNYLLGEIFASQVHYYICAHVLNDTSNISNVSYYNKPAIGKYLKDNIFSPGMRYYWNDMLVKATGEKLTPKYFAKQFIE